MLKFQHTIYILVLFQIYSFSQNNTGNDIRLAHEYYRSKDYDKAEVLFKKVFEKTNAKIYFTYYANCLIEQSKFEIAEKEIKKQIRKHRNDPSYNVDLGYLYKKKGNDVNSKKFYEKALKKLQYKPSQIRGLAYVFMQRKEYSYAEKTYIEGRKKGVDKFRSELANLYAVQRKYDKMINEYLDFLQEARSNLSIVQNRMQYFMKKDVDNDFSDLLRVALLKRVQKPNSNFVYARMLVWFFMQRREFDKALFQEKAIDKRLLFYGKKVLVLAETAIENNDLETASNAYKYIINLGKNKPYYQKAKLGLLDVEFLKTKKGLIKTDEKLLNLEKEFLSALNSFGVNSNTIKTIINLAHLQTFYLNKANAAEKLLTNAINLKNLDSKLSTICKIELGDVLVFENDLDYAALIYGQAEKANKGNLYGDKAKLKKAKLAYYANNFRWAKAQFDALKTSTSKPVSNDALLYSIRISENTEDDSLQTSLKAFAKAELFVFRHKNDSALYILNTLIIANPNHQIVDDAYLLKAEIYESKNNFVKAEENYKKIIDDYSWGILADLAMFKLGLMYEEKLLKKQQAAECYKKLMLEYPSSIRVTEARRRYRKIREGS